MRLALGVVGALVAVTLVGVVLRADPVGYGTVFWPVATAYDQDEARVMADIKAAAHAEASARNDLSGVPDTVRELGYAVTDVRVDRPTSVEGSLLMRVHLVVGDGQPGHPGEVRCREVLVTGSSGLEISSRRVDC
ncbi:hypothetical protein LX83_002278 [Goodfellowiella coeruleoviolacea]|uniref:Uncharacterized protein n=1 Tax=Goodfellowiella coeruleoviolacea TaxID=334858 RepID=A0AAE3GDK4_9PSEU|nr:hypothetical protein [Goodfellowiella coeruleoviolacea]